MSTYLGQNFLHDSVILAFIAEEIHELYCSLDAEVIIEIGPGKGALTNHILGYPSNFFVIEKDPTMLPYLEKIGLKNQQIIVGDILETDLSDLLESYQLLKKDALVVGNLPYYITSPIFKHLFWHEIPELLGGFFMIQHEVGERIKSDANKKSYLWWLVNYAYTVEYMKTVSAECFSPAPKVKSCLVRLTKKPETENVDIQLLERFLNVFSPYSRKTLGKINKMLEKRGICEYKIPVSLQQKRLEELDWEELGMLLKN